MRKSRFVFLSASFLFLSLSAVSALAVRPEKVLLSFNTVNGQYPEGLSMDSSGNLWTVTSYGGSGACSDDPVGINGCGTVVEFTPVAEGWKPRVVYSFRGGNDGWNPHGNLVFDGAGNIYGVTEYGGGANGNYGTVFKLAPVPEGWEESVIYRFNPTVTHNDGRSPEAGVIMDGAGNLYGTTEYGGNGCLSSCGTVYELSPAADGTWTETILYNFQGVGAANDGMYPVAPLVFDRQGNLYGTTFWGGANRETCSGWGCGVVFALLPNGSGRWTETVLHSFESFSSDGFYPLAGLVLDASGNLYGTTSGGGPNTCNDYSYCGTVFKLSSSSGGTWTETLVHSFSSNEGFAPEAGLTFDAGGNLYGTTDVGGVHNQGTAFELSPDSSGGWKESVLHSFGKGQDGQEPNTTLVLDASGNLYGGTFGGGTDVTGPCTEYGVGCGTVFEILP